MSYQKINAILLFVLEQKMIFFVCYKKLNQLKHIYVNNF